MSQIRSELVLFAARATGDPLHFWESKLGLWEPAPLAAERSLRVRLVERNSLRSEVSERCWVVAAVC